MHATRTIMYRRHPDVAWRSVDGQAVLVHTRRGEVKVLNEIGTFLWKHLEDGVDELATTLSDRYGLETEAARGDVLRFLAELREVGAVVEEGP